MAYKLIALDVGKDDGFVRSYTARQGESGDKIQAEIFKYGLPVAQADVTSATFKVVTPLNHYVDTTATWATTSEGYKVLEATTTSNMNSETGYMRRAYYELKMKDGSTLTTPDLIYFVLPVADITSGNAKDYISKVEEVIKQVLADYDKYIQDLKNKFNETADALEEDYNAAKKQLQDSVDAFLKTVNDNLVAITTKVNGLTSQVTDLQTQADALKAQMENIIANGAITKPQADAAYMNIRSTPVTNNDWNTLTAIGTYSVENATGANKPSASSTWGTLLVQGKVHNDSMLTQLYISSNEIWFRRKSGATTWGAWTDVSKGVDDTIAFTLKSDQPRTLNDVYQIGFYYLQGNNLPTDIPDLSTETKEKDGYLVVYRRQNANYIVDTMQTIYFPDLGKVFMRIQKGSINVGSTTPLQWNDWTQIAGGGVDWATIDETIAGVITDKAISPATLKGFADSGDNPIIRLNDLENWFDTKYTMATKKLGMNDVTDVTGKGKLADFSMILKRVGNQVKAYGRYNLNAASDWQTLLTLPTGFKVSNDFKGGTTGDGKPWNVPFAVTKFNSVSSSAQWQAEAAIDVNNNSILRIGSTLGGNTYIRAEWYTDDAFPTADDGVILSYGQVQKDFDLDPYLRESQIEAKIEQAISVGDWIPFTFASGYKSGDGTTLKYRIIKYGDKKKLEWDGAVTNDAGSLPSQTGQFQFGTLPAEIRPAQTKIFTAQANNLSSTGRIAFTPNGQAYGGQTTGAPVSYLYLTNMAYWIGE